MSSHRLDPFDGLQPIVVRRDSVAPRHSCRLVLNWARDAAPYSAGAAFMVLMTQIAIPLLPSPVPMTGQMLAVVVRDAAPGAVRGSLARLLWTAVGIPLPRVRRGRQRPGRASLGRRAPTSSPTEWRSSSLSAAPTAGVGRLRSAVVGGLSKPAFATAVLPSPWASARKLNGTWTLNRREG